MKDGLTQPKDYHTTTAKIVDKTWDRFDLYGIEVAETANTINIMMDENENEEKLRRYLKKQLSKHDLKSYKIVIDKYNQKDLKTDLELNKIRRVVNGYLKDNNYNNIVVTLGTINPTPVLNVQNSPSSGILNESLERNIYNMLLDSDTNLSEFKVNVYY